MLTSSAPADDEDEDPFAKGIQVTSSYARKALCAYTYVLNTPSQMLAYVSTLMLVYPDLFIFHAKSVLMVVLGGGWTASEAFKR